MAWDSPILGSTVYSNESKHFFLGVLQKIDETNRNIAGYKTILSSWAKSVDFTVCHGKWQMNGDDLHWFALICPCFPQFFHGFRDFSWQNPSFVDHCPRKTHGFSTSTRAQNLKFQGQFFPIRTVFAEARPHRRHPRSARGWWWVEGAAAAESATSPGNFLGESFMIELEEFHGISGISWYFRDIIMSYYFMG